MSSKGPATERGVWESGRRARIGEGCGIFDGGVEEVGVGVEDWRRTSQSEEPTKQNWSIRARPERQKTEKSVPLQITPSSTTNEHTPVLCPVNSCTTLPRIDLEPSGRCSSSNAQDLITPMLSPEYSSDAVESKAIQSTGLRCPEREPIRRSGEEEVVEESRGDKSL